ncbi:hypothetical protein CVT26_008200 [Gymnopilus dilepis]|uniref:SUZ domain-containing protein n=1 Tax=Gymnopilus dilepis TaxID=231916 RepID=A0A409XXA2_9AGAR|nr:hypothetical protein CVT26_008200 [Gymnopilus dilepis]
MAGNVDAWDTGAPYTRPPISASSSKSQISKPAPVRDDWDADDDDDEAASPEAIEERNKQVWEDANLKEHRPMPSLVISRGSSSTSTMPSLPINEPPPMRILKRPSPAISPSQSSSSNVSTETLQEREARYQAARERIFGTLAPTGDASDSGDKKKKSPRPTPPTSPPLPPSNRIVREPHGPTANNSNNDLKRNKGFDNRRTKKPPAASLSSSTS